MVTNRIMADFTEDTNKKQREKNLFLLFLDNMAVVLGFLTLIEKHNMHTLFENIKFICSRSETGLKSSHFYLFLKLLQINFIFSNNVRISSVYTVYKRIMI